MLICWPPCATDWAYTLIFTTGAAGSGLVEVMLLETVDIKQFLVF
jgi:hypothetical protein